MRESENDESFRRLQSEVRRPKASPDAISAALEAAQRLAAEMDAEQSAGDTAPVIEVHIVRSFEPPSG